MNEQRQALLDDGFAAWNRHDASAIAALFPSGAVLRTVATGEVTRGRQKIRTLVEGRLQAFPDWRLDRQSMYDCDNAVCVEWLLTGTHTGEFMGIPPTQNSIELPGCSIFKFGPEGPLTEEIVYFDIATILRQLGVLPEPNAA
jgi:steroid delta-isomerase-like uncharacterized protein